MIDGEHQIERHRANNGPQQDGQINERELGVTASVFESGSGVTPFRLVLSSGVPGTRGAMLLDGAELGLTFRELSPARDAVLMVGAADIPGAGILATSSTNRFSKVVEGLDLTVAGSSDEPVTIDVQSTDDSLVSNARLLVTQYNKLRDKIDELTYFNARSEETGILFGSREVLQILRTAVDDLGQTVVIVTHDAKAASYADRVIFLADGRVVDELRSPDTDAILNRMARMEQP